VEQRKTATTSISR